MIASILNNWYLDKRFIITLCYVKKTIYFETLARQALCTPLFTPLRSRENFSKKGYKFSWQWLIFTQMSQKWEQRLLNCCCKRHLHLWTLCFLLSKYKESMLKVFRHWIEDFYQFQAQLYWLNIDPFVVMSFSNIENGRQIGKKEKYKWCPACKSHFNLTKKCLVNFTLMTIKM